MLSWNANRTFLPSFINIFLSTNHCPQVLGRRVSMSLDLRYFDRSLFGGTYLLCLSFSIFKARLGTFCRLFKTGLCGFRRSTTDVFASNTSSRAALTYSMDLSWECHLLEASDIDSQSSGTRWINAMNTYTSNHSPFNLCNYGCIHIPLRLTNPAFSPGVSRHTFSIGSQRLRIKPPCIDPTSSLLHPHRHAQPPYQ